MKSLRIAALLILALAALGLGTACKKPAAAAASAESAAAGSSAVTVAPAVRQTITEKLTYTGSLEAWRTMNLTPETGGKVARLPVEEGQRVAAGQVLAELDTETIDLQLRQAEAGLAVAEAAFANADKNRERMDRLIAQKAVSDQQAEQARLGFDAAKAQLEQARAGLALARHARAGAVLTAPWAGLVAVKSAKVGDLINPMMGGYGAAAGIVTLVDDSRIKVVVEVVPGDIGRLHKGLPAVLRVLDGGPAEAAGTVTVVNSAADALSKKFRVEVDVPNGDRRLRPGTFGEVVFAVQSRENALAIPQKAVLDGSRVLVVEGGKAVRRDVSLGLKNATMVEIRDGLKEGDVVIVEGGFGLIEGTPVEIRK